MDNAQIITATDPRQDTVAKLYALRAGMSILSEDHDKAQAATQRIQDLEAKIQEIKDTKKAIATYKQEVHEAERQERIAYCKWKKFLFGPLKLFLSALLFLVLSFAIACFVDSFVAKLDASFADTFAIIAGLGLTTCLLSLIVFLYRCCQNDNSTEAKKLEAVRKQLELQRKNLESSKAKLSKLIADRSGFFDSLFGKKHKSSSESEPQPETVEEKYAHKIQSLETKITQEEENLHTIGVHFKATYAAMQEQFASFLDERDWGNVDLIIFNYETGRAVDMRDALLQVDNEKRNDRLVDAVHRSTKEISSSIHRGLGSLETSLNIHFSELTGSISSFSSQLGRQLTESSSAQQALLSKINTSSDEMAGSISHMRAIADRNYVSTYGHTYP